MINKETVWNKRCEFVEQCTKHLELRSKNEYEGIKTSTGSKVKVINIPHEVWITSFWKVNGGKKTSVYGEIV